MSTSSYMPDPNVLDGGQAITQQAQQLPSSAQPPQAPPAQAQPPQQQSQSDPTMDQLQNFAPGQADDPNTHGFRGLLRAVGSALLTHAKGAAEGLATGGIPGAIVGAADPNRAKTVYDQDLELRTARVNEAKAQAAQAQQNVDFGKDTHAVNMAIANMNLLEQQRAYDLAPKSIQEGIDQQNEIFASQLDRQGIEKTQEFDNMQDAWNTALQLHSLDPNSQFSYITLKEANGKFGIYHVANPDMPLKEDAEIPMQMADGSLKMLPVRKGTMTVGQFAQKFTQTTNDISKANAQAGARTLQANATGVTDKNKAIANMDNAKAAHAGDVKNEPLVPIVQSDGSIGLVPRTQVPTGAVPAKVGQEFNKQYIVPADATELSYQKFQHAYEEYKSGKSGTGAPAMVALSQHLATTFGSVKGARITKDMIQEHLHARSVSDDALVAVQKLSTGDPLSAKQWDAFRSLITQTRELSWGQAIQNAQRQHINIANALPADIAKRNGMSQTLGQPQANPAAAPQANPASSGDPFAAFGGKKR